MLSNIGTFRKIEIAVLFAIFMAITFFQFHFVTRTWSITPDSTDYVEGARSIAQGKGYVDLTGHPVTLFPPGTSLIYSAAAISGRTDYLFFNYLTRLLFLGYLVLSYLFLRRLRGNLIALIGLIILSFSMVPLLESTRILSDIPFAFSVLLVLCIFRPDRLKNASTRDVSFLSLLLVVSYFIRTEAIYVFAAYLTYIALTVKKNRSRTIAAYSGIFLFGALCWWLRNSQYPGYTYSVLMQKVPWVVDSGISSLDDWRARFLQNSLGQIGALGRAFSNRYDSVWFGSILFCLAVAGAIVNRHADNFLFLLLFIFYIPSHLVAASSQDRFLISLMPVLILLFSDALSGVVRNQRSRLVLAVVIFALLVPYCIAGYRFTRALNLRAQKRNTQFVSLTLNPDFQKLIDAYNANLTSRDVVACFHPNVFRYLLPANVLPVNFLLSTDPQRADSDLQKNRATYLYVDGKSSLLPFMRRVLDEYPAHFRAISSNKGGAIYQIIRFDGGGAKARD